VGGRQRRPQLGLRRARRRCLNVQLRTLRRYDRGVRRHVTRWSAVIVAVVAATVVAAAQAGAQSSDPAPAVEVHFFAADATRPGIVDLHFFGAAGIPVTFYERVGTTLEPLGTRTAASGLATVMPDAVTWRCDRLVRRFVAAARLAGGRLAYGEYSVRTSSCATRLELVVPRRLRPGALGRVSVIDRWGNGDVTPRLCIAPPGAQRTCDRVRLRRATGRWRVELRFRGHRMRRSVAVGAGVGAATPPPVVLATGDSTMQGVDTFLADELGDGAKVVSDVRPSTGISKPFGPWDTLARTQTRRLRQAATVVSLGILDRFALTAPSGVTLECCGAGWVAEYARRVRAMMKTYRRERRGRVLWLTLPLPKGPRVAADAVNLAVVQAAKGVAGVEVLRMDLFFTPGGFRETMPYRGRVVDVRADDGIHLNITGQVIAARIVAGALRRR
jgi:hypothetical protein